MIIFFLAFPSTFACPIHQKRLVSLAPDLTEILYALELENQIVAVSDYSDFPKEAQKKPRIGSFISPNLEKILSFKPDIVFASVEATPPQLIEALKQNKIEIFSFSANREDDIYQTIETIGEKFKREKRGAEIVQAMKSEIESIKRRLKIKRKKNKPNVLIEVEEFPMIVAGRNTLLARAIELAGGINAANSYTDYPKLQLEAVYQLKPELIIIPITQREGKKRGKSHWKGMKNLKGIYEIDAALISRASPRFSEGVKRLARIFDSAGY
ncbi:MAG: helical backbone metal receptor [Deltaproteobacteria bacterium]